MDHIRKVLPKTTSAASRSPCEIPDFDDLRFSTLEHFTSYLHRHPAKKPGATSTTVNEFATTVDWVLHNSDIWKTDPAVVQPIVSYGIQYFDVSRAQVSLFETLHGSSEAQRQGLVSLFEKHPATKLNGNPDAFASHVLVLVDY